MLLPAVLVGASLKTRHYAKSVSGFLAANRCAGRYLITVAYGMAQVGVISLVWFWQQYYDVGFTSVFWGWMEGPAMIILALSGPSRRRRSSLADGPPRSACTVVREIASNKNRTINPSDNHCPDKSDNCVAPVMPLVAKTDMA